MTETLNLPLEGGCRCDRVRIRISAAPLLTMACHCLGCQRMTGSAYSLSAAIPAPGFEVIRGEPVIGGLRGATRHYFCPDCMSWLFTRPEGVDAFVNVRPTLFDETGWCAPFIETQTREKLPWANTPAVHSYEQWPPFDAFDGLMREYAERLRDTAAP